MNMDREYNSNTRYGARDLECVWFEDKGDEVWPSMDLRIWISMLSAWLNG